MSSQLRNNMRWAFGWAIWYAAIFSGWVLLVSLSRSSFQWPEYHTTTWGIVLSYWTAAVLGAGLVGVLRPLTQFRIGAFLVGWITGTLVFGSVAVAAGFGSEAPLWIMAIPGLFVGGGLALVWFDGGRYPSGATTNWRFVTRLVVVATILAIAMKVAGWW